MASDDPKRVETVIRLLLRIERAVSNSERDAIAALEFSKGEIERGLAPTVAATTPKESDAGEEPVGGDFSDLWDDSDEQPG